MQKADSNERLAGWNPLPFVVQWWKNDELPRGDPNVIEYTELLTEQEWEALLTASDERPVLLIKHSTSCPISANAWREYRRFLDSDGDANITCAMVKVIESRPVSNRIAEDLHIRHQSPQVILIQNQKAVWDTSHWSITEDSLKTATANL